MSQLLYICQIPQQSPPIVWTAAGPTDAIASIKSQYDNYEFDDAEEAVRHDMHSAYIADSCFDLFAQVSGTKHQFEATRQGIVNAYASEAYAEADGDYVGEDDSTSGNGEHHFFGGAAVWDEWTETLTVGNRTVECSRDFAPFEAWMILNTEVEHVDL